MKTLIEKICEEIVAKGLWTAEQGREYCELILNYTSPNDGSVLTTLIWDLQNLFPGPVPSYNIHYVSMWIRIVVGWLIR